MTPDELREVLTIGFDCDPTPICAADYCDILRETGADVHVGQVYRVLETLYKDGAIDRDMMFNEKRNCTVYHYFGGLEAQ